LLVGVYLLHFCEGVFEMARGGELTGTWREGAKANAGAGFGLAGCKKNWPGRLAQKWRKTVSFTDGFARYLAIIEKKLTPLTAVVVAGRLPDVQ
jgi:hypothetical protein